MPREVYLVGGAVRDELMGLPTADRDWVVVGATVEAMQAEGYQQVGRDFPVFLHPQTKEEYALARTERKQGSGHTGFVVHADAQVTLEEDLSRRDLTINAIAKSTDGQLIDPYGGVADIQKGVLRHVSDAFIEDPLRVLRVARFAARFPTYSIAPETQALMQRMVTSGELASLSAERVWQEFHRALGHEALPRFFAVLRDCGAQAELFPELGDSKIEQLVSASALTRYARLPLQAAEFESLANRVLAPKEFQQAAADYVSLSAMLSSWPKVSPAHLCDAFTQLGVHHQRLRLQRLVEACTARSRRDDGIEAGAFTQSFAEQIDACAVTFAGVKLNDSELRGPAYGQALRAARIKALEAALHPDMV